MYFRIELEVQLVAAIAIRGPENRKIAKHEHSFTII